MPYRKRNLQPLKSTHSTFLRYITFSAMYTIIIQHVYIGIYKRIPLPLLTQPASTLAPRAAYCEGFQWSLYIFTFARRATHFNWAATSSRSLSDILSARLLTDFRVWEYPTIRSPADVNAKLLMRVFVLLVVYCGASILWVSTISGNRIVLNSRFLCLFFLYFSFNFRIFKIFILREINLNIGKCVYKVRK